MSQSARIRRGSVTAQPRSRAVVTRPKTAAHKAGAKAGSVLALLPVSPVLVQRILRTLACLVVIALLLALAFAFQLPQMAGRAAGEAVGRLGFTVKHVRIEGVDKMDKMPVYSAAVDQESLALPLIDLDEVRGRLLQLGWIKDARVSRRLPDTLLIDIVERVPAAIWQNRQKLMLIDADGIVLDTVKLDQMPDLPLVIGPAANLQAAALTRLLEAAPTIKPMFAGATWIGGRRWDVRFQSGEVLALPEGEETAAKALAKFARMDATAGMLGKGLVRFDMRLPGKMYIRMSSVPGKRVQLGDTGATI